MTATETLKVVLTSYGFDNISIETEKHSLYDITYIIDATSTRYPDNNLYIVGEGLMGALYDILSQVKEMNIGPTLDFMDCSIKDVLNDMTRKRIIEIKLEQEKKVKELADSQKWITKLVEKYNPCEGCRFNTHQHWDDIHYNCEKNHNMSCQWLKTRNMCYAGLLKYNKDKEKYAKEIADLEKCLKQNYNVTHG